MESEYYILNPNDKTYTAFKYRDHSIITPLALLYQDDVLFSLQTHFPDIEFSNDIYSEDLVWVINFKDNMEEFKFKLKYSSFLQRYT